MAEITYAQIMADINKFVTTYCRTGAKLAAEEFTKAAKQAIYMFYMDYRPGDGLGNPQSGHYRTDSYNENSYSHYIRTYDMMANSYKKYYHDNTQTYTGGVRLTSEDMQPYKRTPGHGYPYGQSNPESIRVGVWEHGYRGPKAPSSEPPLEMLMKMTKENNALIKTITSKAMDAAVNDSYSVIKVQRI